MTWLNSYLNERLFSPKTSSFTNDNNVKFLIPFTKSFLRIIPLIPAKLKSLLPMEVVVEEPSEVEILKIQVSQLQSKSKLLFSLHKPES